MKRRFWIGAIVLMFAMLIAVDVVMVVLATRQTITPSPSRPHAASLAEPDSDPATTEDQR